ncbi:MAG: hypothetical protein PVG63_00215 [Anaerolineales bacterium]|jgi:hypothetical protein
MKQHKQFWALLPGRAASLLMILLTALWSFWGIAEMYHEGWWGAWTNRLPYFVPILATMIPSLLAFRWPIVGGGLLLGIGLFVIFFFDFSVGLMGLSIALLGLAFLVDGLQKRRGAQAPAPSSIWWRRNWREILVIGLPALITIGVSVVMLPVVLTRVDDGDRGERLISGNGVTLVWAPLGPGWNWQQEWGGYPSWQALALYGLPPIGLDEKPGYGHTQDGTVFAGQEEMDRYNLCRYLNEEGDALLDTPQDIWHMPTTEELVRSLARHGQNAGCEWPVEVGHRADCDIQPDKESPLWAADMAPIYYWSADSFNQEDAYFVAYNGTVNTAYKLGGNPRHGYRCVREP